MTMGVGVIFSGVSRVPKRDDVGFLRASRLSTLLLAVDVIIDGLLDRLARLELGELLVHEVEVVLREVEGGPLGHLAALAII